ncbi:MAG TPA: hypothetical protein DD426_08715 [Clostridiaceae bacterium]|nr:hypothetical protein [Clostridiaceae bacterium]
MSIIRSHDITLYGGNDTYNIVLKPLSDKYLPYLYRWCADPDVLYWTEDGTNNVELSYNPETVHEIYGVVSQNALCFLIEVNGVPIGDCWLQKMNLPYVLAMYDNTTDVRRIDMSIGEKSYWNRGIGTLFIGMMIDYAFNGEHADVLHCLCGDYNIRSRRMWEKHGFKLALTENLPQPQKGKYQYHYTLSRREYIQKRRFTPPQNEIFKMPIKALQPTQLYISQGKLRLVREWFDPSDPARFDPIPVKKLNGRTIMTDGHTRAIAAYLAGWDSVPVYWDTDELDMEAYALDVKWCDEEKIHSPAELAERIVPHKDYEELWYRRCMENLNPANECSK